MLDNWDVKGRGYCHQVNVLRCAGKYYKIIFQEIITFFEYDKRCTLK